MPRITLADRLTALVNDENLTRRDRDFASSLLTHLRTKKTLTRGRRVWVDRLEARAVEAAKAPKFEVPDDVEALHKKIVEREGASSWAAGFVESVMEQMRRGRTLSEKQRSVLDEKREEYTGSWSSEYQSDYRGDAVLIARYYKTSGLPYYGQMVGSILSSKDYVPPKRSFFKMFNNKYAQRVVEQSTTAALYAPITPPVTNTADTSARRRSSSQSVASSRQRRVVEATPSCSWATLSPSRSRSATS